MFSNRRVHRNGAVGEVLRRFRRRMVRAHLYKRVIFLFTDGVCRDYYYLRPVCAASVLAQLGNRRRVCVHFACACTRSDGARKPTTYIRRA